MSSSLLWHTYTKKEERNKRHSMKRAKNIFFYHFNGKFHDKEKLLTFVRFLSILLYTCDIAHICSICMKENWIIIDNMKIVKSHNHISYEIPLYILAILVLPFLIFAMWVFCGEFLVWKKRLLWSLLSRLNIEQRPSTFFFRFCFCCWGCV